MVRMRENIKQVREKSYIGLVATQVTKNEMN